MANLPAYDPFGMFSDLSRFGIGYDSIVKQFREAQNLIDSSLKSVPGYPPYNVVKVDDDHYVIEMAVAGFGKNSLDIEMKDGVLAITGRINSEVGDELPGTVLYKGIAERSFARKFVLADTVEIKNADLANGMLKIYLENLVPEGKKARKIDITEGMFNPFDPKAWLPKVEDKSKKAA